MSDTPINLDEIRARDAQWRPAPAGPSNAAIACFDRRALLAEVDRLRAVADAAARFVLDWNNRELVKSAGHSAVIDVAGRALVRSLLRAGYKLENLKP